MDAAAMLGTDIAPVPPCLDPAEVEVRGYFLCRGCADALEVILGVAGEVVDEIESERREREELEREPWRASLPRVDIS